MPALQVFVQKYKKKNTQESGQMLVKSTKGTKIAYHALEKSHYFIVYLEKKCP